MTGKARWLKFALIALLCALGTGNGWSATACPMLARDYQPRDGKILMSSGTTKLGEQDLFLYLIAGRHDPLLFLKYEEEKDPERHKALRKDIETELQDMAFVEHLAAQNAASVGWDSFDDVALRVKMHPIYELVWVDKFIRQNISIQPVDVEKYYGEHKEDFAVPETVLAEYIFLKSPDSLSEMERVKVRERLEQIRQEVTKGKSFDEARNVSEPAPAAKDKTVLEIVAGQEPQVLFAVASKLKIGDVSEVIDAKDGFYLLRLKEKHERSYRPLKDVEAEIKSKFLLCKFMRFQYSYELEKLHNDVRPLVDLANFEYYDDEHSIMKVGDFDITKAVFWRLYPGIIQSDFGFDMDTLFREGTRLADLELIAQDCEKRGLVSDERIARGKTICRAMILADKVVQRRVAPQLRLTEDAQKAYFSQHPELFKQHPVKKIYQVWGTIRSERKYSEGEFDFMKKELGQRLGELIKEAKKLAEKEMRDAAQAQEQSGTLSERAPLRTPSFDHSGMFKRLTERYKTREFLFSYKSLGYIRMQDFPQLQEALEKVPFGGFSKIGYYQNNAVTLFVAEEKAGKDLKYEDIKGIVELNLAQSIREKVVREMREEFLRTANLRFLF